MRRDSVFWGGVLILFGVLFLLQAQGLINNVFSLFWPLILMLVGGWMIVKGSSDSSAREPVPSGANTSAACQRA